MSFITENWQAILLAITSALAAASQIAALTPTKKDDEAVNVLAKIFKFLAGNYGYAKNAK